MKRAIIFTSLVVLSAVAAFFIWPRPAAVPHGIPVAWSANERLIPKLQQKLKQDPSNVEANTALGQAYLQKARESGDPAYYSKAEELFDRTLRAKKDYVEALVGKASLALSRHEFRLGRDIAERAIQESPDIVSIYGVLVDAQVELGQYSDAIHTLDKMIRMKPNLSSYSRISYLRELNGDIEGAVQAMKMAIDSGAPEAENTAWCMVQLGNLYLIGGQRNSAEIQYRMALARFPNYVHAFAGLAKLAVAEGDYTKAIEFYQRAIAGIPLPEFLIALGEVYDHLGKTVEAQQQYATVKAIQQMYRSNGVNMDLEMVLFNVDHGGDVAEAIKIAQAEWQGRKSVKVADAYAWALFRAGRTAEARDMMKQAMRLGSKDPVILHHATIIG